MNKTEVSPENRYTDYDPWAWLYNQSEAHLACERLLPNIEKLLLPHLDPGAKIFDLCCGTGQLSQELAKRGYQIVGLDGSEEMLHYARQNAPNAEFILGDARDFKLDSAPVDAVICTDSALNHMMNCAELQSVFRNVYDVLTANGLFVFDMGLENRYSNIAIADGEMQANYAWTVSEAYDSAAKIGTFTITMFQPDEEKTNYKSSLSQTLKRNLYNKFLRGIKPSTLLQLKEPDWNSSIMNFSVKPYTQNEIKSALTEVGFSSINVYDSEGKLAKPTEDTDAYFVVRKS